MWKTTLVIFSFLSSEAHLSLNSPSSSQISFSSKVVLHEICRVSGSSLGDTGTSLYFVSLSCHCVLFLGSNAYGGYSTALNVLVVNPLQAFTVHEWQTCRPSNLYTYDYKMAAGYLYCTSLQVRTVHFFFYYREPSHVFVWFTGGDFNSKTSHWNLLFSRMVNMFSKYFCHWLESMISCSHLTV